MQARKSTQTVTSKCSDWLTVWQKPSSEVKIFGQNPWKKELKKFIVNSFLTVSRNTCSKMYSCTSVLNCLSTLENKYILEQRALVDRGRSSDINQFISYELQSHNLSGYRLNNLSQKTTCFKSVTSSYNIKMVKINQFN